MSSCSLLRADRVSAVSLRALSSCERSSATSKFKFWTTSVSPPLPLGGVTDASPTLSTTPESSLRSSATSFASFRIEASRHSSLSPLLLDAPPRTVPVGAARRPPIVSTLASAARLIVNSVLSSDTSSDSFLIATSALSALRAFPEVPSPPSLPPPVVRAWSAAAIRASILDLVLLVLVLLPSGVVGTTAASVLPLALALPVVLKPLGASDTFLPPLVDDTIPSVGAFPAIGYAAAFCDTSPAAKSIRVDAPALLATVSAVAPLDDGSAEPPAAFGARTGAKSSSLAFMLLLPPPGLLPPLLLPFGGGTPDSAVGSPLPPPPVIEEERDGGGVATAVASPIEAGGGGSRVLRLREAEAKDGDALASKVVVALEEALLLRVRVAAPPAAPESLPFVALGTGDVQAELKGASPLS